MRETKTFKRGATELELWGFDSDKELEIDMDDSKRVVYIYLSPNQTNDLITFLAEQLKSINEPIDILSK